ncbi:ParA family partition ATPase [Salinibacter ruber]|uniref:ParA family partition ATPase n=1 Tax=Salinibacter ruber TaxID=146919 RepID=UPI002168019C|nr:ParA family partition ATPase [Salinibacter ruber]
MPLVIGIVSPKGGSGKTTTAIHLARSIQQTGDSVAILDTDPQGSALAWASKRDEGPLIPVLDGDTDAVQRVLDREGATYDVVVIDGAAKIEPRTGHVVGASDVCLIPVQPTPLDAWGAEQVVETVAGSGTPAGFLITQQKPRTNLASRVAEGLEQKYGLPVLDARLSHRVAFAESIFGGSTALDTSGAGKAKEEIEALTDELKTFIQNHVG